MQSLGEFLDSVVARYGDHPALLYKPRYRTEVWTYTRLRDESDRVAAWLRAQGVERGDRVAVWAPNSPLWVAVFFGALRIGAVLVPLDVRSGPDFAERAVAHSDPKLGIVSRLTSAGWLFPVRCVEIEDLLTLIADAAIGDWPALDSSDIAEIMFTSGTTGSPKGVILTHGNILANAESVEHVIPSLPEFRVLSLLPLSHMFEQTVGLILALGRGASIVYPASRQSTVIFAALQESCITTILAVPQALQLFMDAIEREVDRQGKKRQWQLLGRLAEHLPLRWRRLLFRSVYQKLGGHLEFLVSGGAEIEPELMRKWELLGIPVLQGYGATETSPVVTTTSLDDRDPATVGRPVPGVEVKVVDDGEVLVRGHNVTSGYWHDPEDTAAAFEDGWYRTGDLGSLDARGRLHLRGRKKNMLVLSNGQNVYPEDVESVLRQVMHVSDPLVVGLPDSGGTSVHAVFLPDAHDPASVVKRANARLAPQQQIRGFTVWPEPDFPRTHTLKIKRQDVVARLLAMQEAKGEQPAEPDAAAEGVTRLVRLVADAAHIAPSAVSPEMTLGEGAGLDSLGRVELLAAIEAELGVYIDDEKVVPETTVAYLQSIVDRHESAERPHFPRWPLWGPAVLLRRLIQDAMFWMLGLVAPLSVRGREELQSVAPPVLFVVNHTSHLDSPALLKALPSRWRGHAAVAAAADYFFARRWLGLLVSLLLNAFPFSRTGAVRPTLEHCARLLDGGWSILIYPEGTRSTTGEIGEFKSGVGLLAVELEVPVIPARIGGLRQVLPKGRALPRRGRATVTFGQPLYFEPGTSYDVAASRIEEAVRALPADAERS